MERIIQPYAAPGAPSTARPGPALHAPTPASPPKSPSDLLRAARRGLPVILVLTALFGTLGAAYVMKMPAVYRSVAHVQIEPPRFDSNLAIILGNNAIPTNDREVSEKFVPNRLAWLQGRGLASAVIAQGEMGIGRGYEANPEAEILTNISQRRFQPGTNIFEVSLEGGDPERVKKLLTSLLEAFQSQVRKESLDALDNAKQTSVASINDLVKQVDTLDNDIRKVIAAAPIIAPGGTNIALEDYTALKGQLFGMKARYGDLRFEERMAAMYPGLKEAAMPSKSQKKRDYLEERADIYQEHLDEAARVIRNINTDPASRRWAKLLNKALNDIDALDRDDLPSARPDRAAIKAAHSSEEIRLLERQVENQLARIQETMPEYERYQTLHKDREAKQAQMAGMKEKLSQFAMVSATNTEPVKIIQHPTEPAGPSRPNRPMLIVLIASCGFLLGLGLVCGREFLDHSVKVPEHLAAGLTLPILSVIPRMRRIARLDRGGHLWTANDPLAPEADAYRNLRASLIGASGPKAPIVTLLVTSAKPGEGKSTTALNLALTCARAGERTLLLEADLRRPSLADVFDAGDLNVGLVEVLRGEMPWQQAVIRTDVPNLNFLPSGDPTGVPIEILGTLELRQLIAALSGTFQRVIIDAPAVLGMADCRMLGRTVDAAVLVVRSGVHSMLPLRRAKEMLEQSRVPIAGVVFNGLTDDLDNWSSHTAMPAVGRAGMRASLENPSSEPVATA
jgi:polysaccharide biosynthesis transport protein